ncbi:hypothetical protein Q1W73_02910 [Asticcacaulis sp. ZE23SCel15]|uniref:hypothetical protein n=1 Tax=Asticcacaulis sp. ZE23SCel15 TaxID=3059027 RepID=UPI00265F14D3|nr:hypothetical protein [Asticcacaulis sp. ZE23SCel15]WKL57948.1 hypothetical protein Q1W73_02910 [Asticcacaulis sp. ZE23SCel15]
MRRFIAATVMALTVAFACMAQAAETYKGNDNRIDQAVWVKGRVWLRSNATRLSYIEPDRDVRVPVNVGDERVISLCRDGGDLLALTTEDWGKNPRTLRRLKGDHWQVVATFSDDGQHVRGMICDKRRITIVTSSHVIEVRGDKAQLTPLKRILRYSGDTYLLAKGDHIYVGMDAGEWGGGLHRIDRRTSEIVTIGPENGQCGDVLYPECDAVTGVAPIPWKPDCVAVTTGKAHLSTMRGALIEVCGTQYRVLLQKEYQPAPPIKPDAQYPVGHVPFLGVYAKDGVLMALTASHAYEFRDGKLMRERQLPPREILGGVSVSFGDADIVRVQPYVQTATSRAYGYPLLVVK